MFQIQINNHIMKFSTQFLRCLTVALVGSFAAFSPTLLAQTTATTDPVGFITLTVAGTGGTVANQLSFAGLSLTRTVEYQGSAESVSKATSGANTLTDNDATWTDNQFNGAAGSYFVEITSGAAAGTTYDISATTAATKTITLVQDLANSITNGAQIPALSFKIRKAWTIGAALGTSNPPESGLQTGSAATADQVLLYNGASYDTYFYSSGGLIGAGWRKQGGGSTDQSGAKINPEQGVIVNRLQSANLSVVLMGAVKTGATSTPVFPGLNFVSNIYAANMTLGSSSLYTDGTGATGVLPGSAATADTVQIYNGTSYDTYFYSSGGLIGAGWRKQGGGSADQSGVALPVGVSVIVTRQGGTGFNWVAPQHPATI